MVMTGHLERGSQVLFGHSGAATYKGGPRPCTHPWRLYNHGPSKTTTNDQHPPTFISLYNAIVHLYTKRQTSVSIVYVLTAVQYRHFLSNVTDETLLVSPPKSHSMSTYALTPEDFSYCHNMIP